MSDIIKYGVIGTGIMGQEHIQNINMCIQSMMCVRQTNDLRTTDQDCCTHLCIHHSLHRVVDLFVAPRAIA